MPINDETLREAEAAAVEAMASVQNGTLMPDLKPAVPLVAGVYDDMPRAVYESLRAINFSKLKNFSKTAAHAKHLIDFPPEPTAPLEIGQGTHVAVLEPARFGEEYIAAPLCDRRTTAGKRAWKEFTEANSAKSVLPAEDYETIACMRDAIWDGDSVAKAMLAAPGKNERSIVWRETEFNLWCKARLDRQAKWNGWPVVIDIKTARSADPESFSRDIAKYHYHVQAAFYLHGLDQLASVQRRWFWIVLEKEPPWLHAVYEPTDRLLEQGERTFKTWLAEYAECVHSNQWPGYANTPQPIDIPRWSQDTDAP